MVTWKEVESVKRFRSVLVGGLAVVSLALAAGVSATPAGAAPAAVCSGGVIAPGVYYSLTVTGFCMTPNSGYVYVQTDLTVEPGALLDAITLGQLNVQRNLIVGAGGALGLGCSPEAGCPGTTRDSVGGKLMADSPAALIIHSSTLGGISSIGGSAEVDCGGEGPAYSTFEDNHIKGSVNVTGYTGCWFGFIRNNVQGSVTLNDNTLADPDAMEIVTNWITGSLSCAGNTPAPQVGDSAGAPNIVGGGKFGQCTSV
jgi:hypothetical protein